MAIIETIHQNNIERREQRPGQPMIALQGRLLQAGEALNPVKILPVTTEASLGNFQSRDYTPFQIASDHERQDHWNGRENDNFNQQLASWKNQMVTTFSARKTFFTENKDWKDFFSNLHIDVDNFTDASAQQLYGRYFTNENETQPLKKFVTEVLNTHSNNGLVDYDALNSHRDAISWFSHIFGNHSSEVITELIDAEAKLLVPGKKAEFISALNQTTNGQLKINTVTEREKILLEFVNPHSNTVQEPTTPSRETNTTPSQPDEDNSPEKVLNMVAETIFNVDTGQPTGNKVDLSQYFSGFVDRINELMDEDIEVFASPDPKVVLTPLAEIMMDKVATEANRKNKELGFTIQGVKIEKNGKEVFIGAYIVPTMEFSNAQDTTTTVDQEAYRRYSHSLAQNTNLQNYFSEKTTFSNGKFLVNCHIHQDQLGEIHRARPSQHDYRQIEENCREYQEPQVWAVLTKTANGELYHSLFYSAEENGNILHKPIDFITEDEIIESLEEHSTPQAA